MRNPPQPATLRTRSDLFDDSARPAATALTKTGGFLSGYTHTLQPYIGCRYGCQYCYVKGLAVHRFHQPQLDWGRYAHPRTDIDAKLRSELSRLKRKGGLDRLRIFMSSATDPYQGSERTWRLTQKCLDVFIDFPPGLLVIQTRSPLVREDFTRLHRLGDRCWLNLTIETDREDVRRAVTPSCPSLAQRWDTVRGASAAGLNVQITVSPCLPFSAVERFGSRLLEHADRVIVDTFVSGDGSQGRRTARSGIDGLFTSQGWGDWRSEEAARTLYRWLEHRIGVNAGWSQQGFAALLPDSPKEHS